MIISQVVWIQRLRVLSTRWCNSSGRQQVESPGCSAPLWRPIWAVRPGAANPVRNRSLTHTHARARPRPVLPRDSRVHHKHSAASLSSQHPKSCRLQSRIHCSSFTGSLQSLSSLPVRRSRYGRGSPRTRGPSEYFSREYRPEVQR